MSLSETGIDAADAPEPGPEAPAEGGAVPAAPARRGALRTLLGLNRSALAGLTTVALIALFCFLGPLFYRTNQVTVRLDLAELPPSGSHPLGTDASGYDVLGRLMEGGRSSLELGLAVAVATTVLGALYGAFAGLVGGVVDALMMRVIDTLLAVPGLVLLLILVNLFPPSLWLIIILLSLLSWLGVARLVRAEVLSLRTRDFVVAATMMGAKRSRVVLRHLLPNAIGVIIVSATFTIADAILALSTLSFLGLGLPPPHADWGTMLSDGLNYLFDGYWWLVYPPAIILIVTVVAFNLIGDAIHNSLDLRER
ncbi:ABC transporter permease [Streptacidiphilus sp. P02-A3a]|uniref:ABC transporter permease n=1 Tax=Streptacidiphilus sp. P02-A3a TaxID=2704468 RepID=UPI0015FC3B46|nr:ABC transporter permease [Streptacidiphilus sp. P02-A3a]QMU72777.1 ABC transporter permease [Streptacidiphilus sp. P02-A3a]